MRKLLFALTCMAVMLFAASCNKSIDSGVVVSGQEVTATFEVYSPDVALTKAISDGTLATSLTVAVYDSQGNYLDDLSAHATISEQAPSWKVKVKLIAGVSYKFIFFAKCPTDNGFSSFDPENASLAIDYSKLTSNNDKADFFYALYVPQGEITGSFAQTVEMYRPLAQVNFGASDLDEAAYSVITAATGDNSMKTGVTLTGIYSGMDLFSGDVTGDAADVTFSQAVRVSEESKFVAGYDRVAMAYALVASDQANVTATLNATVTGKKDGVHYSINREVINVPLKRNYRTNILGNLFTSDAVFTVNTHEGFYHEAYGDEHVDDYVPTFVNVTQINEKLAEGIHALALDVPSGTAIDSTINLPDTDADIYLYILNDHSAEGNTLNIQYTEGATRHPANLYFYAKKLHTLNGTLPNTHVEINSYSYIETGVMETSGTTLVIQPFAYYGNLRIIKGSLLIEGIRDAETGEYVKDENDKEAKGIVGSVIINVPANEKAPIVNNGLLGDSTSVGTVVIVESGESAITGKGTVGGNIEVTGEHSFVNVDVEVTGKVDVTENATVTINTEVEVTKDATATVITGEDVIWDETQQKYVEVVATLSGDGYATTKYEDLKDAFAALVDDKPATIKVKKVILIEGNAGIPIGKNKIVTLDLDGWTIMNLVNENKASQVFNNEGNFTIIDSSAEKDGVITNSSAPGTQTGEWWSTPQYNWATNVIKNSGVLNVKGGTIYNTAASSICYAVDNNSTSYDAILNLYDGGTLTGVGTVVRQFCNSTTKQNAVNVYGGTIKTDGYAAIWTQLPSENSARKPLATLKIEGGLISAGSYAWYDYSFGDSFEAVDYNISGGEFKGGIYSYAITRDVIDGFISGGVFSKKPSEDYITFGYAAYASSDKWEVLAMPNWIDFAASDAAFATATDEDNKVISIDTPELLAKLAKNVNEEVSRYEGYTIKLTADIDLKEKMWTPIGLASYYHNFLGTFDGNGKTISNLSVKNANAAGLFGCINGGVIKNVNLTNARVYSNHYAGPVVAWVEKGAAEMIVTGCTVTGGWVKSAPEFVNDEWDNGDKAGGLVGFAYGGTYTNNTVSGLSKVKAYRDLSGLLGYAIYSTVAGNSVSNLTVCQCNYHAYKSETVTTYAELIGRDGGDNIIQENTISDVTLKTSNR